MGERTLRPSTKFVRTYSALMDLINDATHEICAILPIGEDCLQVSCMPKQDTEDSFITSSVVNAAFTTCYGRLHLYKYLEMVGERACYHDTDSVCYLAKPGYPDPPIGQHIGDLTDQIQDDYGPGSICIELVAGGCKNYAYKVAKGGDMNDIAVVIKVRGISLISSNEELLTFENLKSMVKNDAPSITVPLPSQIARLPGWRIVTRDSSKKWQVCLNKRRRVNKDETVPFGYMRESEWTQEDEELLEVLEELASS